MKKILMLIRLDAYVKTKKALLNIGIVAMSSQVVQGRGKKSIPFEIDNDDDKVNVMQQDDPLLPKQLIEIIVEDKLVDDVVKTVISTNMTGNSGDGKIFIIPVDDVLTIRTNKHEI